MVDSLPSEVDPPLFRELPFRNSAAVGLPARCTSRRFTKAKRLMLKRSIGETVKLVMWSPMGRLASLGVVSALQASLVQHRHYQPYERNVIDELAPRLLRGSYR